MKKVIDMKMYGGTYHYDTCGLDNIYLRGGVFVTEIDGEKCFSITNLDGLHKAIARDLTNKKTPLTNKEFRFLRVELDMTQKALAELFGCDAQTIAHYEKGRTAIPKPTDLLLRLYYLATQIKKIDGELKALRAKVEEMKVAKAAPAKPKKNVFAISKDKKVWQPELQAAA